MSIRYRKELELNLCIKSGVASSTLQSVDSARRFLVVAGICKRLVPVEEIKLPKASDGTELFRMPMYLGTISSKA